MRYLQINIDYYRLQLLTEKAKIIYILALNINEVQVKSETVLCLLKTLKMPCDIYKLLSINILYKNAIYQS